MTISSTILTKTPRCELPVRRSPCGRRYPSAALLPDASPLAAAAAGRRSGGAYAAALGALRTGRDGCRRPALGAAPGGQRAPVVSGAVGIVAVPPHVLPHGAILQSAVVGGYGGGLRAVASDRATRAARTMDLCGSPRAGALHTLPRRNCSGCHGRSAPGAAPPRSTSRPSADPRSPAPAAASRQVAPAGQAAGRTTGPRHLRHRG